jgi:hypothetical protein
MTDAETITRLRTMLAERDAEIRRLRVFAALAAGNIETAKSLWGSDLPDGSRMTITFPARSHDQG